MGTATATGGFGGGGGRRATPDGRPDSSGGASLSLFTPATGEGAEGCAWLGAAKDGGS